MDSHDIARRRTAIHDGTKRGQSQILPDRDLIGVIAEQRFAETYALTMNMDITPSGDGGVDFVTRVGNTVDIKATTRANGRLMVNKPEADIYVLAIVDVGAESARFVGWVSKAELFLKASLLVYHGKNFYCLNQSQLHRFM